MDISEVKSNFHKKVIYNGNEYELLECIMWFDENERRFRYSVVLKDNRSRSSLIRADIESVKVIRIEDLINGSSI